MPNATGSGHLESIDFYDLLEDQLSRGRRRELEAHLDGCSDCVETLSMIVRSGRPASREEQADLAAIPEPSAEEVVPRLASSIEGSRGASGEWKLLLVAASVFLSVAAGAWTLYTRGFVPASSRRVAAETLSAMMELRHSTGRIPLRYITELERASVTRSGFDDRDPAEEALLSNLRGTVERAPEPEALLLLGLLLLDDGEIEEAEALFQRVLEEDPDSADALNGLAVAQYVRAERDPKESYRHLQRGLAFLREAASAAPEDLRMLYNFGKFYEAMEMPAAAIQAWKRYLEKDGSSPWAEEASQQLLQLGGR